MYSVCSGLAKYRVSDQTLVIPWSSISSLYSFEVILVNFRLEHFKGLPIYIDGVGYCKND